MTILSSLKSQKHFDSVNKQGKKLYSQHFLLVLATNYSEIDPTSYSEIRFGMKVNKKLGTAVIRNKIKRRIRHLIRNTSRNILLSSARIKLGLIIVPKKGFEKFKFLELQSEFEKLVIPKIVR
ncbi:MAG: ribonuclease P protein component [Janthinobacterium lividum]